MSSSSATPMILWWAFSTGRMLSGSLKSFRERLAKFGLELHPDKTRLIEFGRYRRPRPEAARRGKTGDLHVLGLHPLLWADGTSTGAFTVWRITAQEADGCEAQSHQG